MILIKERWKIEGWSKDIIISLSVSLDSVKYRGKLNIFFNLIQYTCLWLLNIFVWHRHLDFIILETYFDFYFRLLQTTCSMPSNFKIRKLHHVDEFIWIKPRGSDARVRLAQLQSNVTSISKGRFQKKNKLRPTLC